MVDQVVCISECGDPFTKCAVTDPPQEGVRAALAVRYGNGLRAKYGGDSIYFKDGQTHPNCTAYKDMGGKCPVEAPLNISIMALPVVP